MSKKLTTILLILLCAIIAVGAVKSYTEGHNFKVKGWLFGKDEEFVGQRDWGTTGLLDTLVISNVDTLCLVFLTGKTSNTGELYYDIATAGDTIFVTTEDTCTASTDKYNYMIVRNGYSATD
jgi:hypothetical protein